jgi:glutamine amidotransferase
MQRIAVIDYGMGNLRSVSKAIEHVADNAEVVVSSEIRVIESADRVVCPGQGAAADCMSALQQSGLVQTIVEIVGTRPFLGICMGYQILLTTSDENGGVDCLNIIPGRVVRFDDPLVDIDTRLKVPHMGWSEVRQAQQHALWSEIDDGSRFYFAHSYYCLPDDAAVVTGTCRYGREIAVSLAVPNLFACQFHPEKSARDGLQLLRNFTQWDGRD